MPTRPSIFYRASSPHIARRRTKNLSICLYIKYLHKNDSVMTRLQLVLFGFMNKMASHLERSPLIHSYGYDYYGRPALALRARFAHANLLPANLSAGDRPTCFARLFVSSMRLTPSGLTRYFVPDKILFIKPNRTN